MTSPALPPVFMKRQPLPGLFSSFALLLALLSQLEIVASPVLTPGPSTPLASVRLLDGPFAEAVKANRAYLLALDVDRLLAPFLREAGLQAKDRPYGNWESGGLDGHTAGHYLSAL